MDEFRIGISAYPTADPSLLAAAGIGWLRQGFRFPFVDRLGGEISEEYRQAKASAEGWAAKGFQVMGVTPLIGLARYEPDEQGQLRRRWRDWYPSWMGMAPSAEFYRNYQAICTFLAEDLSGVVQMWQIANELDVAPFAGPLTPRHACDFVLHAARGLKEVDSSLIVGTNFTGRIKSYYFYGRLYADPRHPFDYCGADGYYGTWKEGGPQEWVDRIAEIHDLTGVKVLVNEWGYASAGGLMSEEERRTGLDTCHFKRWPFAWGDGHTAEVQAEHVRATLEVFRSSRDKLLGAFFYRWEDQEKCWACGEPDCPAETAWGLVDRQGQPKPAYFAFKEGVQRLKGG